MTISADIQELIVGRGLTLSAILVTLQLLSWRLAPDIWLGELSDGKQKGNQQGYFLYLVLMFGTITGFLIYSDNEIVEYTLDQTSQFSLFIFNCFVVTIYGLIDLFVIDLLVYDRLKPGLMQLDSLEQNPGAMHHVRYFLRFEIVAGVFCFIASVISG